jgi:DNA-directed RNA polymerase subunit RPC12/RpoP
MPVILIKLPEVNYNHNNRPGECPNCGSQILQRWGRVTKPIKGREDTVAIIYRYRCGECERTFRHYPQNIDRATHAQGIRRLAALLWALGLSYREIIRIFSKYEITLSLSTVWRESKELSSLIEEKGIKRVRKEFRIDKTYIHRISNQFGLVLAVDLCNGEYMVVGTINEHNPATVISWLRPLAQGTQIEIAQFGTDTLDPIFLPT